MIFKDLIRNNIRKFKTYTPSKTMDQISQEVGIPVGKILKIDSGENPYVEIMQNKKLLEIINLYLYPDPRCTVLRQKLSSYTGYGKEWILCGNGSDELIDLLIRTFVSPKDEIIISPPTFSMYAFYGKLSDAKIITVLRDKNFCIKTQYIIRKISDKTKIIFIDSPGNPTSVVTSIYEVEKLLKTKINVVVDEAYFEYCKCTVLPLVKQYPNLIVLRTLSKWAGLAGLRIGYMVANPTIIDFVSSIKAPYSVNSFAQEAGSWILDNKDKYLKVIDEIVSFRNEFINRLSGFPDLKVYPSQGAYIIFRSKTDAAKIYEFLKQNGILIKIIIQPGLQNCLRINLLQKKDMERFVFQLRRFYEN